MLKSSSVVGSSFSLLEYKISLSLSLRTLIESFKSTLLVATEADLLIHVVDAATAVPELHMNTVSKILEQIGTTANEILVFNKIDKIDKVHNYLDNLDGVGKVLSFSSILKVAKQLNNNKELGTLEMGVLYSKIPDSIKKEIVDPYISIEHNEARINLRIKDSQEGLRRNELIKKIQYDLENKLNLKKDEFKLTGVLIFNPCLYTFSKPYFSTIDFLTSST